MDPDRAFVKPTFTPTELDGLKWRTADGQEVEGAVEVARTDDGWILMRRRGHLEEGVVVFTPAEMDAWIKGCKAGEFDDIADLA